MRRGIARFPRLLSLACAVWIVAGLSHQFGGPARGRRRYIPPADRLRVIAVDGCLRVVPPPYPRHKIGDVNGKPGDLADLKPGSELSGTELRDCNWRGVDLREVTMIMVFLSHADLRGANFRGATLAAVGMDRANLRGANFQGALLWGVDLDSADLRGADLSGVRFGRWTTHGCYYDHLECVSFKGARHDRATRWPAGFDPKATGARLDE